MWRLWPKVVAFLEIIDWPIWNDERIDLNSHRVCRRKTERESPAKEKQRKPRPDRAIYPSSSAWAPSQRGLKRTEIRSSDSRDQSKTCWKCPTVGFGMEWLRCHPQPPLILPFFILCVTLVAVVRHGRVVRTEIWERWDPAGRRSSFGWFVSKLTCSTRQPRTKGAQWAKEMEATRTGCVVFGLSQKIWGPPLEI